MEAASRGAADAAGTVVGILPGTDRGDANEHVTVALSGDGGDELFAGYNRHAWAPRLWELAHRLPKRAKRALSALQWVSVDDWDRAFRAVGLGEALRLPGDKLYKVAALAEVDTPQGLYERLIT